MTSPQQTAAEPGEWLEAGPAETLVGETLGGRYRVLSRIGSGGMGVVYAAEHVALRCQVALKILNPELRHRRAAMERFKQEARVGALLRHPQLVRVFDFDDTGSIAFLAMEFLVGQDLKRLLQLEQRLPLVRAVDLMCHALTGLAAAHALGIVHRDLKPANLFVESGGGHEGCRLLDFGVAKVTGQVAARSDDALTMSGRPLGTLAYMAPEQIRGDRSVDARADVYSACAILFEMLCARRWCEAESPTEQMFRALHERPPRADSVLPNCPSGLADIIARGLDSNPNRRFAHAGELAAALQPFGASEPTHVLADRSHAARTRGSSLPAAAVGLGLGLALGLFLPSRGAEVRHSPSAPSLVTARPMTSLAMPAASLQAHVPPSTSASALAQPALSARAERPTRTRVDSTSSATIRLRPAEQVNVERSNPYE